MRGESLDFVSGNASSSLRKVGVYFSEGSLASGIRLEALVSVIKYTKVDDSLAKRSQDEIPLPDAFVWNAKIIPFHNLVAIQYNIKIYTTRPLLYSFSPTKADLYGF